MSVDVGISVIGGRTRYTRQVTPLSACDEAEVFLLNAGFRLVWQSSKSEARYFSGLGRHGTIRIATHAKRYKESGIGMDNMSALGPVIASITFPEGGAGKNGLIKISGECVEFKTATAIGLYLIRSSPNK